MGVLRRSVTTYLHKSLLLLIGWLMISANVSAGSFTALGSQQYVRGTGSPVTESTNFSVKNPSTQYTLEVINGGLEDATYEYVSSSVILLNGVQLFGPSDFNQNMSSLEAVVSLQSSNELSVTLMGKPNGAITINIVGVDTDLPTITSTVSPAANTVSWNNTDTTVSFSCDDATSAIVSCSSPVTVTTDGANQSIAGSATDEAGNGASSTVSINLDKTAPVITAAVTPVAYVAGWNNSDVTVSFTCSDTLSGIASCPAPIIVSTEGIAQVVSGTATDFAGNSATASVDISLDTTLPSIGSVLSGQPNATGWYNTPVTIT